VIEIAEALELAHSDLATATSLLDLRFIAGEERLMRELEDRAYAGLFSEGELGRFVERLEQEAASRHARFGGSVYLLEPDVKAGAGGLRDLDVARWAARARYRTSEAAEGGTWAALVRLGAMVPREAAEITSAEEFLSRVRNRLHAHAARKSDRLTFDQQELIAVKLQYARRESARPPDRALPSQASPERDDDFTVQERGAAAERFMQDYFKHARIVSRSREALMLRATPQTARRGRRPVEVDLGNKLRLFDGQLTVDPAAVASDPALALRAYSACIAHSCPMLPFAREAIARAAGDSEWAARLRASPEAARLFLELLCTVRDAPTKRGSMMGELHEVGLLLAMIPEFAPVTGRVHHDVYHVYTVDVHSVAAVDALAALCRGDCVHDRPLASRLAAEMARPLPLFLATLLHDVGKGYPDASGSRKNHSVTGAELCDVILPRFGIGAEDAAEVRSLVRDHLMMYHVATRRDLDDPAVIRDFCSQMRGREGLRNLYLLTVCDLSTTSPTAMTTWKARMLDELYFASESAFGGVEPFAMAQAQRAKDAALAQWKGPREVLEAFVESMPERYLSSTTSEAICAHAQVSLERAQRGSMTHVCVVPSRHADVIELCVVARDAPGLLARIAAVLTASRLEVLAAQVYSRRRAADAPGQRHEPSEAVDVFWVRDARGGVAASVELAAGQRAQLERLPRLGQDLESVCSGQISAEDLLRDRTGSASPWRERPSPMVTSEVVVDDRASPSHTVVEVFAKDQPGLLFRLARAMHELGLSIALSKINTEGNKVADVFYVTDLNGEKVQPGPRFREIRDALLAVVDAGDVRGAPGEAIGIARSRSD